MPKIVERIWKWKPATRWSIVAAVALASIAIVASLGPIPQAQSYHHFADTRTWLSVPNTMDVLSNLPFVLVSVGGLHFTLRRPSALPRAQRWAYATLFAGLILTGFGSAYYHLAPDNQRLVADRLPMTIAMSGFTAALLADRWGNKTLFVLPLLLVLGVGTVIQWDASERLGHGDLRWYGLYQGLTIVIGTLVLLIFPSSRSGTKQFVVAAGGNIAAKIFELLDQPIYHLGGLVSGHTLKHLSAGLAFIPLMMLISRRPAACTSKAALGGLQERSFSHHE